MTALPKIPRPATLIALTTLAALAVLSAACTESTFTDARDGKTYRTVKIGKQRWMAENLNFVTDSSICYNNTDSNGTKYGQLYKWNDAMNACPAPWRVPSDEDWDSLSLAVGGVRNEDGDWVIAGKRLKSKFGWNENGNGTDDYGFSALPGGFGHFSSGRFYNAGDNGNWWSATEVDAYTAMGWGMSYDNDNVYSYYNFKWSILNSVRCVKDIAK